MTFCLKITTFSETVNNLQGTQGVCVQEHQNLRGNLRILLLNNGRGGIFNMLPGLEQSPARDRFVAAAHHTSAEGICQQNHVTYLKATNMEEMQKGIASLIHQECDTPMLLEVFTDPSDDQTALQTYYQALA